LFELTIDCGLLGRATTGFCKLITFYTLIPLSLVVLPAKIHLHKYNFDNNILQLKIIVRLWQRPDNSNRNC
jgi:hypothetical protein